MLFRVAVGAVAIILFVPDCGVPAPSQVAKLYPVDEADRDPSFFTFRARLFKAVQRRDVEYVVSILSPSITTSLGGGGGVGEFQRYWNPERPDSEFWETMTTVLALGGSFHNADMFMAPYTYSKFPDQLDAFQYSVVIGGNVRVRKYATPDAPVITTLSYDIVQVSILNAEHNAKPARNWVGVTLNDGKRGYVARDYVRSPIDYRAIFQRENGKWQLAAFVAGD
jgi:hypothetical protein